jgi:hypothetical protein
VRLSPFFSCANSISIIGQHTGLPVVHDVVVAVLDSEVCHLVGSDLAARLGRPELRGQDEGVLARTASQAAILDQGLYATPEIPTFAA